MANNIQAAYSYFIGKGLSPNAAAGIVGNLKAESNVDPMSNQQGGPGMGIAQWSEGGRWDSLLAWAGNRNPRDLQTQLDFLWHELQTGYSHVLNKLQNTTSMAYATEVFMKEFEIPADVSASAVAGRVNLADDVRDNNTANGRASGGGDGGGGSGSGGGGGTSKGDYGFDPQFLEDHPEIRKLVDEAVDTEISVTKFQARLKETQWWLNHTAAQRDWQMTQAEDPATAAETLKGYEQQIRTLAQQMGVTLRPGEITTLAEKAARNSFDATELQMVVGGKFGLGKGPQTGQASTITQDLEAMADAYALPMSREQKAKWTTNILQGQQTVDGYNDVLREKAKALYPHLADAIDRAGSVRGWADSYLQQAANMLGVSPETMRLDRGKYSMLLRPTKDGSPPTMDQWERVLMKDERFGYDSTNGAQADAAGLATQIGRAMGAL